MTIKKIGNASENTTDVGLRTVASKLYFDKTSVARNWLKPAPLTPRWLTIVPLIRSRPRLLIASAYPSAASFDTHAVAPPPSNSSQNNPSAAASYTARSAHTHE